MIPFDPSDIVNWADKPDAQHRLPEFIRRLILATVPMPSLLHMPSGSSVWRPGWDGVLVVKSGNAWVPDGASKWELSCEKQPKRKATADYKKRTAEPEATFVFVTPRTWDEDDERKWMSDREAKREWADVRVLDVDDLVAWLGQAPAVAHWFARLIGKLPATGVVPLDEWWENWSSVAKPPISLSLVTAGRQEQAERIGQWFKAAPSHYYVQGDTEEEAIAFLAGSAGVDETPWGSTLLTRTVVIENVDAWRSIEGHSSPLVIIRAFSAGNVSPQMAVGRGHHVLTPLGGHHEPMGEGITLPRLGREETLRELIKMGLSDAKARALARSTARRMTIIRRLLVDEAGGPTPEWATSSTPHSIVSLILMGQWDADNERDKKVVSQVAGQTYEAVERDLADLKSIDESPLTKVGSRWRFTSHEEAWHLLVPRLTSSEVHRFERVATEVLGEVSPEFELPTEQRYMANVYGKTLPHSGTLREGIARSLALMGTQAHRAGNVDEMPYVPVRVVSAALCGKKGWRIWATLGDCLTELAEASPEAILAAVERDLDSDPSPFKDLFDQEGDGFFGGTPHTGLLWALELLAWSSGNFSRVAICLALLSEIDPGGKVSNRPEKSLVSLFLPWTRYSEASDQHRLETLEMLLDAVPRAGWRLVVEAYPASNGYLIHRDPPSWQPWAQDGSPKTTVGEFRAFTVQLTKMLFDNVGTKADRWADLVGIIAKFSPKDRQRAIELLSQQSEDLRQDPASHELWIRLRGHLHHHRSYPDATWAMDAGSLTVLEAVYRQLTPTDPALAYAPLFDNWPDLPEGKPSGHSEATERIAEARQAAVQAAYERGSVSSILSIARAAEVPYEVGAAVALGIGPRLALDLALDHLESSEPKLRNMASGGLRALFIQSGWKPLAEIIAKAKASGSMPQVLADIFLAAPAVRETWQRLENESREVRTAYWKSTSWFITSEWDAQDLDFAVRQLISVRRSVDAAEWLASQPIPHELVIQLLEAIPVDVAASPDLSPRVDDYRVAELFKKLDQSGDVSDRLIAGLEIPYIEILDHHRPQLAMHRQVINDPSLFVDVICRAFKRADGQAEHSVDNQVRKLRAPVAFSVLWKLRLIPGLMEDDTVHAEVLLTWVNEARRMCKDLDRQDIGDEQIGQIFANAPAGQDGVWPCEPVRDLLDDLASRHIGIGFVTGKRNLRGITSRGVFDGGEQERSLAEKYRHDASRIAGRRPFTAQLLCQLAADYESEARNHDQSADWSDQFE